LTNVLSGYAWEGWRSGFPRARPPGRNESACKEPDAAGRPQTAGTSVVRARRRPRVRGWRTGGRAARSGSEARASNEWTRAPFCISLPVARGPPAGCAGRFFGGGRRITSTYRVAGSERSDGPEADVQGRCALTLPPTCKPGSYSSSALRVSLTGNLTCGRRRLPEPLFAAWPRGRTTSCSEILAAV